MIINYFKIAFRNLQRHRNYAALNITGLSIGITVSLLIGMYVVHEYSFDKFHENYDRIFRVCIKGKLGNNDFKGPISPYPLAETLMQESNEVEQTLKIFPTYGIRISHANNVITEDKVLFSDSNFFNFFTFKLVEGHSDRVLVEKNSAVITQSVADSLFPNERAIGKTIFIKDRDSAAYTVTGIMEEMPANSHFHARIIFSSNSLYFENKHNWLANNAFTYVLLKEGASSASVEKTLSALINKYLGPQIQQMAGISINDFLKKRNEWVFSLQPLSQVHLHSNFDYEIEGNGSVYYVYLFIAVAIFILVIACINFTNLATARSFNKIREAGLRRTAGASKLDIVFQFISESMMLSGIAIVIAIFFTELLIPGFQKLLGVQAIWLGWEWYIYIPILILLTFFIGFVAGIYPALFMASFKPADVLKKYIYQGRTVSLMRNILVTFQFWVCIIIMLITLMVYRQLDFANNKPLGFDKDNVILLEHLDQIKGYTRDFIEEIKKVYGVESVTGASGMPGRVYANMGFSLEGRQRDEAFLMSLVVADENYFSTLGITLKEGRFFNPFNLDDTASAIINESAVKYLGLDKPLGAKILNPTDALSGGDSYKVIGVVNDFHFESLYKKINPLIFWYSQKYDYFIAVKYRPNMKNEVINAMHNIGNKYIPGSTLIYSDFEQTFGNYYRSDYQTRKVMLVFSLLAILVACLGLLGLVIYNTEKRTKEIGIRKALGASAIEIALLLSKNTWRLVFTAAIVAIPFAYFLMDWWLNKFAYHISVSTIFFIIVSAIAIVIAQVTILYHALKAARQNPVLSLRYE